MNEILVSQQEVNGQCITSLELEEWDVIATHICVVVASQKKCTKLDVVMG
jgi:hypothetical protein